MNVKMLHTSDLHLKNTNNLELKDFDKTIEQMIILAEGMDVKYFIFSGDFTDSYNPSIDIRLHQIEIIKKLTEKFIVIAIYGQHDMPKWGISNMHILEKLELKNFYLLDKKRPSKIFKDAVFYGVDYIKLNEIEDEIDKAIRFFKRQDKKRAKIFMFHYPLPGAKTSTGYKITGKIFKNWKLLTNEIDYGAIGDIHKFQEYGNMVFYCGSPLQLDFSDVDEKKGCIILDWDDKKRELEMEFKELESPKKFKYIKQGEKVALDEIVKIKNKKDSDELKILNLLNFKTALKKYCDNEKKKNMFKLGDEIYMEAKNE